MNKPDGTSYSIPHTIGNCDYVRGPRDAPVITGPTGRGHLPKKNGKTIYNMLGKPGKKGRVLYDPEGR